MKFLIDMPLAPSLARWLNQQGHDAVHASEIGLSTVSDTQIIARAFQDGHVIVTADLDYPRLLAITQAQAPGLILFRGGDYSDSEVI